MNCRTEIEKIRTIKLASRQAIHCLHKVYTPMVFMERLQLFWHSGQITFQIL